MNVVVARLPVALALVLALCPGARADQFTVTSGTVTIPSALGTGAFTLVGVADGFSLTGHVEQGVGQLSCFPCSSSSTVTLQGPLSDTTFGGLNGTFNGVDYAALFFTGLMTVTSPSFAGSMLLDSTTIVLPFNFLALLSGYQSATDAFNGINPVFSGANFGGTGTVTAFFTPIPVAPGQTPLFNLHDATFHFGSSLPAPTPEPATLFLFGGVQ